MVVQRRISQILFEADIDDIYNTRRLSGIVLEVDIDTSVCAISYLNPNIGPIGYTIHVIGINFEAAQGAGTVTVSGIAATVTSWSDTDIVITIPIGTVTGDVIVTNNSGEVSNPALFTIGAAPVVGGVLGLSPEIPVVGQIITPGAVLGNPPVRS